MVEPTYVEEEMSKRRVITLLACCFTVWLLIAGCSATPVAKTRPGDSGKGERIVAISRSLLGSPYRYGGESKAGFDCSGLVRYVYRQLGLEVPHSSRLLYRQASRVDLKRLRPGDLLFFRIDGKTVSHVAIYTGAGRFIHAPSSGKKVSYARLDNRYWKKRLAGAGRF